MTHRRTSLNWLAGNPTCATCAQGGQHRPTYCLAAGAAAGWRAVAAGSHRRVGDPRAQVRGGRQLRRRGREGQGLLLGRPSCRQLLRSAGCLWVLQTQARAAAADSCRLTVAPVVWLAGPALLACRRRLGRGGGKHAAQLLGGRQLRGKPAGCWLLRWLPCLLLVLLLPNILVVWLRRSRAAKPLLLGVGCSDQALQLRRQCLGAGRCCCGGAGLRWCSGSA